MLFRSEDLPGSLYRTYYLHKPHIDNLYSFNRDSVIYLTRDTRRFKTCRLKYVGGCMYIYLAENTSTTRPRTTSYNSLFESNFVTHWPIVGILRVKNVCRAIDKKFVVYPLHKYFFNHLYLKRHTE